MSGWFLGNRFLLQDKLPHKIWWSYFSSASLIASQAQYCVSSFSKPSPAARTSSIVLVKGRSWSSVNITFIIPIVHVYWQGSILRPRFDVVATSSTPSFFNAFQKASALFLCCTFFPFNLISLTWDDSPRDLEIKAAWQTVRQLCALPWNFEIAYRLKWWFPIERWNSCWS